VSSDESEQASAPIAMAIATPTARMRLAPMGSALNVALKVVETLLPNSAVDGKAREPKELRWSHLVHFPWGYWRRAQTDGQDDRAPLPEERGSGACTEMTVERGGAEQDDQRCGHATPRSTSRWSRQAGSAVLGSMRPAHGRIERHAAEGSRSSLCRRRTRRHPTVSCDHIASRSAERRG